MIRSRMFQTIGLGVVFALSAPNAHAAGECIEYDGAFFTSPAGCIVDPGDIYNKAYGFQEFDFNGTPQLAMDLGDDLKFFSLANPSAPLAGGQTRFQMPHVGDAEHLMYQFSVDDDANYAFTVHRTGVAIAHLGTGSLPAPAATLRLLLDSSSEIEFTDSNLGGLLFSHGNQTYVLTHVFVDACNDASLYRLGTSGSSVTRTLVECVAYPSDAQAVGIQGGRRVGNYLFVALNKATSATIKENVSIYEIQDPGPSLTLRRSNAFIGSVLRRNGFALDKANGLIASVDPGGRTVKILAAGFQSQGSWTNPISKATIPVPANGSVNPSIRGPRNVAIAWPLLWIDGGGLYDITQPSSPTVIVSAVDYFHPSAGGLQNPTQHNCLDRNDVAAVFHPNGTGLYLPRFPIAQSFDLSACTGPVQPIAAATVTPAPAFPGQSITIRDTSAGTVESRAIWVTQGSNPDGSPVAGSPTLVAATSGNQTLSWTVPVDLPVDNIYYAHVKVANADFPYSGSTPQQLKSVAISVDRAPDATISITPAAPITGSTISIQTTAEGSPGDAQGADPFELWVTAPGGQATSAGTWGVGGTAPSVQLTESGSWTLEVRVQYRHGASGGGDPDQDGLYEVYESLNLDISSVAANFTIRENPTYQNADIHLDNSSSSADGAILSYQWEVRSAFSDTAPIVHTCSTTNCVIPADTLVPGNHRFRLTLTNSATDPADVSTKYIDKTVIDGNINPEIVLGSTTPAVGAGVTFHIDGIQNPNGIDQIVWNFGGPSCDSVPQTWTCHPGDTGAGFCLDAAYHYSSTGAKTVTATITFDGTVLNPPASISFSVGPGSCGGTPSCSYSISPTSASFDALANTGGFQVSASPSTCTWSASEGLSWVSITSGSSGTGNGTVSYSVTQNSSGATRSGSISVAGRSFQITQTTAGLCAATLSPNPATGLILNGEPNASVAIQLSIQSGCDWTAKSLAGWLHVTPSAGVGNGTVTLRADENTWSDDRVGAFEIAGVSYELTQYPNLPADFDVSNIGPDRGEYVTFTVDPRMEVASWNFGDGDSMGTGQDCHGYGPVISCATVGQTACHTMRWNWPDQGPKLVTMTLANGDSQTHGVWVQNEGECPCETDPPATSFEMSANPVLAGEEVTFTDTTPDGTLNLKVQSTLIASPPNPIIGQSVSFIINAETADRVEWNYGATGCGGTPATNTTTGTWAYAGGLHTYATGGVFTVRATAYSGSTQIGSATLQLTVQNTGSCDGGGGGGGGGTTCTYSISPLYNTFDSDGGSGQINITTQTDCDWNATESMSWVTLTSSASGTGNGTVTYNVVTNPGGERSGAITVAGKTHTVTQAAEPPPPAGGPPETWTWRVLKDGLVQTTAEGRSFTWKTPRHEATYDVELTTSNCGGSTTVTHTLEVLPPVIPPVTKMLVPAAVRAEGLNNTLWKTDLNIFNPCDRTLHMRLTFLEDNQNNVNVVSPFILPSLAPLGSLIYTDVIDVFPFLEGQNIKGSIQIEWDDLDDCRPVVTSRTYNDTPTGTFGQSIPTFNITPSLDDHIFFTGLASSAASRTNLGFANFGDTDVTIMVTLLDDNGQAIGNPIYPVVPALSTIQVVRVANVAGVNDDLDAFSARIDTGGAAVMGYASVIDNTTGDSWSYVQGSTALFDVVVPGLAHVAGLNDSQWRSDIAFFNSTEDPVNCSLIYYPEDQSVAPSGLALGQMQPGAVHNFHDFVGALLGAEAQSKGYLRAECLNGASFPIVAARTYNEAPDGGTFGQNMVAFGEGSLIETGAAAWIPGIVNSSDPDTGFRSNLGIVNVSDTDWLGVHMTLYGNDGEILGEVRNWLILPPGGFYQKNPFAVLGDVEGSLKVEVYSGSAMIYLSKIDNMTGDPTTVLAIPAETLQ